MPKYKIGALQQDDEEISLPEEVDLSASNTSFDITTPIGMLIGETDTQKAIERIYLKGARFVLPLHYLSFSGNTTMGNGSIFRVYPSTTVSNASYAGYVKCSPLQVPFKMKIHHVAITFTIANFDWNATPGNVQFDLVVMKMLHNSSTDINQINCSWGSYSGSQIPYDFNQKELTGSELTFQNPNEFFEGDLIGFRFVKSPSGDRRINNFQNITMSILFEEIP